MALHDSPQRIAEVWLSRRAEKALLRQARAYWVGTRDGLKQAVRQYVRRHRGQAGMLNDLLRSSARAATVALLLLQMYAAPVEASGTPNFRSPVFAPFGLTSFLTGNAPVFADLDADGDLDLIKGVVNGGVYGSFEYFENTGSSASPAFGRRFGSDSPLNGLFAGFRSAPSFGDLDNDGDLDLISGEHYGSFQYFENTGSSASPAFIQRSGSDNPLDGQDVGLLSTPSFVDLDADGDLDLAGGRSDPQFQYFENTGSSASPAFIQRSDSDNPLNGLNSGYWSALSFVDLDADGDLDLISGEYFGTFSYFENTGSSSSPAFIQRSGPDNPLNGRDIGPQSKTAFGDVDGDGDLDLIAGDYFGGFYYFQNAPPAPEFSITVLGVNVGETQVGNTLFHNLWVVNEGDANLTVNGSGLDDGPFQLLSALLSDNFNNVVDPDVDIESPDPIVVAPGYTLSFYFSFSPAASGAFEDLLTLTTNDEDEGIVEIPFSGTGIIRTLDISEVFVEPGDTDPGVDILLRNSGPGVVNGLQFDIDLSQVQHASLGPAASDILDDEASLPEGFQASGNLLNGGNTLRVVIFSTSDAIIPPGPDPVVVARLSYVAGDVLGSEDRLDFIPGTIKVGDRNANLLDFVSEGGAIQVGIPCDVNLDGRIDIRDVVVLVAGLVGRPGFSAPTDPDNIHFKIQNAAGEEDGSETPESIDVADAIGIVNKILGDEGPFTRPVSGAPVSLALGAPVVLSDGQTAIPVILDGPAAGLQATMTFDPALVRIGAPFGAEGGGLLVDSRVENGTLRLVAVSLSAGGLPGNGQPALYIPATLLGDEEAILSVTELTLADRSAHSVEIAPGIVSQTIAKGAAAPKAFSLSGARPNPFNPVTGIAYDVPQQAHIQLVVYNLLGQEVVRLVDQMQAPGHYSVTWDARNAQGQAVSSGVYLYRLISSTGFSESRRMTLLK